jgi:deoxyribonuclease-4
MFIGAHMSVAGGVPTAFARGESVGCTALQIFVKNANQWQGKPIPEEHVREFAAERARTGIGPVVAHASYLINLASPDPALRRRSIAALVDELERCERLGVDGLVLHPGSHVGEGASRGLRRVAGGASRALDSTRGFRVKLLLETTAGQGTNLGSRFEDLARIRAGVRAPERVGTCLDTCHVFAAGYDLRTADAVRRTLDAFDGICGLDTLGAIHLNDSLKPFASRRDRHAHIGEGEIGRAGFGAFLTDPRVQAVPILLETPKGDDLREDARNLKLVRALAAGKMPRRTAGLTTDAWKRGTLRGAARSGTPRT